MTTLPLYRQIANRLREEVAACKPSERLTSETALAASWGVSRFTVAKAVEELVAEGLVVRRQGAGTFVASTPLRKQPGILMSFTEAVGAAGRVASHELLSFEQWPGHATPPFEVEGAAVVMDRLRCVDGTPVARHNSVVPQDVVERTGLTKDICARTDFSFYRFLSDRGCPVASATERLNARMATPDECTILALSPDSVVIVVYRQSFDAEGRVLDMVEAVYDARRYYYETKLVRATAPDPAIGLSDDGTAHIPPGTGGPGLDLGHGSPPPRRRRARRRRE
ncbi:GntR family transcriptional regulator [Gluconacetobacter entanii]|uniref:GntR family transcriptional regulator n=1 Tax=Gluconacetobacter entanii TaxID=108528 RepID=A0ABT3K638_9PROT|nr:GntR family transcriptional regulator [Gluconacetobacter entanii]MCE2578642.1 GntR family transcriptional regulator [Komagataeibacter sp. FNDCR1]MCW4590869.1 GntR family transcriptional regulator [Gluconacetobacter entanii]MCW4593041.1 GntR family transcriptional regulator [Gluconacetobacter entanii]NPC90195.1 GntR family transcriptional regulator [Gluconacetobacter entanii]